MPCAVGLCGWGGYDGVFGGVRGAGMSSVLAESLMLRNLLIRQAPNPYI
jgi:hypothetical protein